MAKLQPPDGSHSIINQGDILQKEDLKFLYAWRNRFQKEWNVPLLIQVSTDFLELPPYPASTLFVGVGLSHGEAVIAVPPLVRKALGENLRLEAEENLALCIKNSAEITAHKNLAEESSPEQLATSTHAASSVIATCLDASFKHLWKALE